MQSAPHTECHVVDVISSEITPERVQTLQALRASLPGRDGAPIIHIGFGSAHRLSPLVRLDAPEPWDVALAARFWRIVCERAMRARDGRAAVLHAWTFRAAVACELMCEVAVERGDAVPAVVISTSEEADAARAGAWFARRRTARAERSIAVVCSTAQQARRVAAQALDRDEWVLIPGAVEAGEAYPGRRGATRERLGLANSDDVVLVLPPVDRGGGAFRAAWAVLLVHRIRPGTRLIVPGHGHDAERAAYLMSACRHPELLRTPDDSIPLDGLLAAADVAVALPDRPTGVAAIMAAMAAGTPLLGSAISPITELLRHGESALLCDPGDPRDAARRLLNVLEDRAAAMRRAEHARGLAVRDFTLDRMLGEYRRLYARLGGAAAVGERAAGGGSGAV